MYWEVLENHDQGCQRCHEIFSLTPPGQTGVISAKILPKSYKISLNYSSRLFNIRDVGFFPLLAFKGIIYDSKWARRQDIIICTMCVCVRPCMLLSRSFL